MNSERLDRLYDYAADCAARGLIDQSVTALREILTEEPDHGAAHALLSVNLLDQKRLVAAEYEAEQSIALEPMLAVSHYAISRVRMAQKRMQESLEHVLIARQLEPDDDDYVRIQADLLETLERRDEARELYARALELGPDNPKNHAWFGLFLLGQGEVEDAERCAQRALALQPADRDGLILMGRVHLQRGEVEAAREHAIWVLQGDATDVGALHLLCGVKARKSPILGLWWRYSTWVGQLSDARSVFVLVGSAIFIHLVFLVLRDLGLEDMARLVDNAWMAVVAYTWVGPAWFERALAKELGQVELDDDF